MPEQPSAALPAPLQARLEIRELLENWVLWRDAGEWDLFASLWHDDGQMNATWFKASATEFIAGCRKVFDAGVIALHSLGGTTIELHGTRAITQTKMRIVQRGLVHGVAVDVSCEGRFFDAIEWRDGRWGMVLRQPAYEFDQITSVEPGATIRLDPDLLASFPEGYRHLAYIQTQLGFDVFRALPGTRGPEIAYLRARMKAWLTDGTPLSGL